MRKLTATSIALIIVLTAQPAFAWGENGHKTVGQIAQSILSNTTTLTRVKSKLRPSETLSSISNWADWVKDEDNFNPMAVHHDSDTQHFYRRMDNRNNRNWHFVNLPLDCASYASCPAFQKPEDIVRMINLCILKLRGGNVPRLTQRNAVRMLVHLVGDLHQPLHVGCGFPNVDDDTNQIQIVTNPAVILQNGLRHDRGGNLLLISGEDSNNLHSFWDGDLVQDAMNNQSLSAFAQSLRSQFPGSPAWDATGPINTWAAQWASDSVRVSKRNAYNTVVLTRVVVIDEQTKYRSRFGDAYKSDNVPVVKEQLAKGGYRLARLLQAIFP